MNILIRNLKDEDRQRSLWIEAGALPGVSYVNDVWDNFTSGEDGFFFGAYLDGELGGIGKMTMLYNGYGWLETLRVHPDFQSKGLGKAIYEAFMSHRETLGVGALGMYTEIYNERSAELANKYGLILKARYREFVKEVVPTDSDDFGTFIKLDAHRGELLMEPHYKEIGEFLVINRTYYPVRSGLGKHLGEKGWLFLDAAGNLIVAGFRFQPEKALHLGYFSGEIDKILAFANAYGKQLKSSRLSAMRDAKDEKEQSILINNFNQEDDYLTLWKDLDNSKGE